MTHKEMMKIRESIFCKVDEKVIEILDELVDELAIDGIYVKINLLSKEIEDAQDALAETLTKIVEQELNYKA